jgi:hypothetical protein
VANKADKPAPGWWAVPQNIGNARQWAYLPPEHVLSCMALSLAATGYCISFETETITEVELARHIVVGAASSESVLEAAKHLLAAGIWTEVPGVGIDCGAAEHIKAKNDRIERSRKGGLAKAAKYGQEEANPWDGEEQ